MTEDMQDLNLEEVAAYLASLNVAWQTRALAMTPERDLADMAFFDCWEWLKKHAVVFHLDNASNTYVSGEAPRTTPDITQSWHVLSPSIIENPKTST